MKAKFIYENINFERGKGLEIGMIPKFEKAVEEFLRIEHLEKRDKVNSIDISRNGSHLEFIVASNYAMDPETTKEYLTNTIIESGLDQFIDLDPVYFIDKFPFVFQFYFKDSLGIKDRRYYWIEERGEWEVRVKNGIDKTFLSALRPRAQKI